MSFDSKRAIEAEAFMVLKPYIVEKSDGRYVVTSKGTLARWLQESVGDIIANDKDENLFAIELKAEQKHTGNLFLETWSNKNLDERQNHGCHGSNPGWLFKIRADLLFYYFLDADILYSIDVFRLKRWAFGNGPRGKERAGRLWDFQEKLVVDDQKNDTWGRPVPVVILWNELRGAIKKTSVRQRGLAA